MMSFLALLRDLTVDIEVPLELSKVPEIGSSKELMPIKLCRKH